MPLKRLNGQEPAPRDGQLLAPTSADPTHYLPKVETGRLMGILVRRLWMVILLAVLGVAGMLWLANRMPKMYRAEGSVYVASQAPVVLDIRAVAQEETRDLEQMRSVEQGMASTELLNRMIEVFGLAEDPKFAKPGDGPEALLDRISNRISVELLRGTRIIGITATDNDPLRAKSMVEFLVAEYENLTTERQQSITLQANEGLANEEMRLKERMEESAQKLRDFRIEHPVPGLERPESSGPLSGVLDALNSQLTAATAERLQLEAEHEAYGKFDPANPESIAGIENTERGSEVLVQVRELQLKRAEFARVKQRYLFKHPTYLEVENEISVLEENLVDTVGAAGNALEQRFEIAKENEAKLVEEVARASGTAVGNEGMREEFRALLRAANADRDLHDSVTLRLRETQLAATVPASVIRWENTPLIPEKPSSPRKLMFATLGGIFGLFCGSILLVVTELNDRKVRGHSGASRATGSPLLVAVPAHENPGNGTLLMSDPSSDSAEAFRRLRLVLGPAPGANSGRTVLFASARSGEGKSFCALNHATALAMQGHRTLLVDADLRSPGLSRDHLSDAEMDSGLGGFLDGKVEPASACHGTGMENLYILSSGAMRSDAAELLAGTRFPSLLEDSYRWFDRIVIDSPAVLTASDALGMARYADYCCLVVRDGGCDRRDLKHTADLIRSSGGNLVGFVWNEAVVNRRIASTSGPMVPAQRKGLETPQPAAMTTGSSNELIISDRLE